MSTLNVQNIEGITGFTVGDLTYPSSGQLSNRNLIINGAMQVAQRGISETGITGAGYHTADRMRLSFNNAAGATVSQSVVTGQNVGDFIANALKNDVTATASQGECGLNYRVEDDDVAPYVGKTMMLSFYAKADSAVNIYPAISGNTTVTGSTISLTTSYQRYYVSFTMPAVSSVSYLDIRLRADATVSTANYITGVQLEVGDTATPFEHRSHGDELARCQRYYFFENQTVYGARYSSGSGFAGFASLPVTMRANPTLGYTSIRTTAGLAAYATDNSAQYLMVHTSPYVGGLTADAEL